MEKRDLLPSGRTPTIWILQFRSEPREHLRGRIPKIWAGSPSSGTRSGPPVQKKGFSDALRVRASRLLHREASMWVDGILISEPADVVGNGFRFDNQAILALLLGPSFCPCGPEATSSSHPKSFAATTAPRAEIFSWCSAMR